MREADIVIAAAGQREFIKQDWIKEGATVIDVGIHSVADQSKKVGPNSLPDLK